MVVDIDRGFLDTSQRTLRLAHINAPEKDTAEGKQAKTYLEHLLPKERWALQLDTVKLGTDQDKYGRYLAVIRAGRLNVNDDLVTSGHAVAYEGGAR